MRLFAEKIIKSRKAILIIFATLLVISLNLSKMVSVNFDLTAYLPDDANSTIALKVAEEEFNTASSNARILIEDVSIAQAMEYKKQISEIDGVDEITWLDDATNVYIPLDLIPKKNLDTYYKDNNALFNVTINEDKSVETIEQIQKIIDEKGEITGSIIKPEKQGASATLKYILPIIIVVLLISTNSWFEPVIFLIVIGTAIILNNGTNAFLGEISFVTSSSSTILLLAVSMDYSIFLLHKFSEYKNEGLEVEEALAKAIEKSFSSISASGLTTAVGFGALIFMRFKIGADLGIVLTKGILIALATILLLLPTLLMYSYKIIDKTHHKSFMPSFAPISKISMKVGGIFLVLVLLLSYPMYKAQNKNEFIYSASGTEVDITKTEELYGKSNDMFLLVPRGNLAKEKELNDRLLEKDYINSVISYVNTVGDITPQSAVPKDTLAKLQSENYSRFVLNLSTEQESELAFTAYEEIYDMANELYKDEVLISGGTANIYDMKQTVTKDNELVTILGILGIGIIVAITFKSISIPIILLLAIESSIWLNMSVNYFLDETLIYLGFMIVSSIQLGATVDYAILFAHRYLENREHLNKMQSAKNTICDTAGSILTSGTILTASGLVLSKVSTDATTSQLGLLIGRGALISVVIILLFLPTALVVMDKLVQKTTLGLKVYEEEEKKVKKYKIREN